tara:strand:+ start:2159 stop:2446 length:288 start_codon:yes stop_codon:yes gene_type:complete
VQNCYIALTHNIIKLYKLFKLTQKVCILSNTISQNIINKIVVTYGGIYPASKVLDVDYSTLWRWKEGKVNPNTATLQRILISMNDGDSKKITNAD